MMANLCYKIKWETRMCRVGDEYGYFHTWEQFSQPIEPSPLQWGHQGGTVSRVYGIVEFRDGVRRVDVNDIVFCDGENAELAVANKYLKEIDMKKKENNNAED